MGSKTVNRTIWLRKLASLLPSQKEKKRPPSKPFTSHHDLNFLFEELNRTYFQGSLSLDVDWYGSGVTASRSAVRLGYYHMKTQKIRINKLLDSPNVPSYFVSFIVYHEVLHHLYPPICPLGSRRKIHHPLFKQKEREFALYLESQDFLKRLKQEIFSPTSSKRKIL